jgi:hypothetical protein
MTSRSLAALFAHTDGQRGHFTVAQAAAAAVTASSLSRLRRVGLVEDVFHGVLRVTSHPQTDEGLAVAAALAAGGVVSHSWAAWLLGSKRVARTRQPEVVVAGDSRVRIRGVTAHRTAQLDPCDVTTERGVPITSGARTTVDCARLLGIDQRMTMADEMIAARHTTRAWLHRRARALQRSRPGVATLAWITRPGAEGEFWSWLERRFNTGVVRAHCLPAPEWNVALRDATGFIGFGDAVWRGVREVVVEIEGLRFHSQPEHRRKDARRANRYVLSGRVPLRFTYQDVLAHAGRTAAHVREALAAAGVPGVRPPG